MALFGRDSLIASIQAMVAQPAVAMGTLENLARWQSDVDDPDRDAEPGKIPHELLVGEWAHFGIVPHRPYYGTADATPLYLLLLAENFRWSGDADALGDFRGAAERALEWVDRHGDRDGDGFQEYAPRSPRGYRNQSWRDAHDGVLDDGGAFPELPIATSEMQAYVYGAKTRIAPLFELGATTRRRLGCAARRQSCGGASSIPSGSTMWASWRSCSMATKSRSARWCRTRDTACGWGSSTRSGDVRRGGA